MSIGSGCGILNNVNNKDSYDDEVANPELALPIRRLKKGS
jgi:hypothetical protein